MSASSSLSSLSSLSTSFSSPSDWGRTSDWGSSQSSLSTSFHSRFTSSFAPPEVKNAWGSHESHDEPVVKTEPVETEVDDVAQAVAGRGAGGHGGGRGDVAGAGAAGAAEMDPAAASAWVVAAASAGAAGAVAAVAGGIGNAGTAVGVGKAGAAGAVADSHDAWLRLRHNGMPLPDFYAHEVAKAAFAMNIVTLPTRQRYERREEVLRLQIFHAYWGMWNQFHRRGVGILSAGPQEGAAEICQAFVKISTDAAKQECRKTHSEVLKSLMKDFTEFWVEYAKALTEP